MIPFQNMPANFRLPGVYIEFDNSLAGRAEQEFKVLVIGQRLAAGAVAQGVPTRSVSDAQDELDFGRGSMLAEMLKAMRKVDRYMPVYAVALDDNAAGVAATKTVTVAGTATESGTSNLYIAGTRVQIAVASGAAATAVAAAIVTAVGADTTLPVTAAAVGAVVTLTAKNKGECGNDIDVRLNYYGEKTPAGITLTIAAGVAGTGNPNIATAIAAFGQEWWNWIVNPYTDATNLTALETELNNRWGPTQQKGARAFIATRGSYAATSSFGNGRNSPHVCHIGTNIVPEPTYLWAAVNAMRSAPALALDPARPLRTLELTGLKAPPIELRWTDAERNNLLYDGTSTYTVTPDGRCVIERQITMYQVNSAGVSDISYLDIHRPETLERVRFEQRARVSLRFPRHKLSSTDERFGTGQPIVTKDSMTAELVSLYQDFIELGWCQDLEGYKASLVVEIDTGLGRLNWKDEPRLIGQAQIFAGLMQFRI